MSETKTFKIVFAGGGTGGHIYPGIAVADEVKTIFKENNVPVKIYWIGSDRGMDKNLVEKNLTSQGGSIDEFIGIPCGKLRRYFSWENFTDLFRIAAGYFKAKKTLRKIQPDLLFSKGGFVSVPPCRAAKKLHIPFYTHECDFTPGLATRLNSKNADGIFVTYEETKKYFTDDLKKKCTVTGNPVRPVFYDNSSKEGKLFLNIDSKNKKPILLVLGGSLGARQINNMVIENLEWLKENFVVVHQTGKAFADENAPIMNSYDADYKPYAFIYNEMPSVIHASDVILSRAGANSIWESSVAGKPMVLVPLCGAGTRGDQVDNARYFEKNQAAYVLAGEDANKENLREALTELLDKKKRKEFSKNSAALSEGVRPARKIAEILFKVVKE